MASRTPVTPFTTLAAFTSALAAIPFAPRQAQAKGILAPLIRAMGHILYLVGALGETGYTLNAGEPENELAHAAAHLDTAAALRSPILSRAAQQHIIAWTAAVSAARDSYANWNDTERATALRALADRGAGLAAFFDREFAGVPTADSDPGTDL